MKRNLKILILFLFTLVGTKMFSQGNGNFQWIMNQDGASTNDLLRWDGTAWKPATIAAIGGVTGTGVSRNVAFWTGTSTIDRDTFFNYNTSHQLSIGRSFADGSSRLTLMGTGTSTSTFGITHKNSSGVTVFQLRDDGSMAIGAATATVIDKSTVTPSGAFTFNIAASQKVQFSSNSTGTSYVSFGSGSTITPLQAAFEASNTSTTVTHVDLQFASGFSPTSTGTNTFTNILVAPTINQTGGHTGISYGSRYNPTLTAAADWRSIQIDNASGYGIYQSNSGADNFFNGQVGIGAVPSGSNALTVSGGQKWDFGSDAAGDIYYRNSGGTISRLGVGSNTQVLTLSSGLPSWQNAGSGADNWGTQVVVKDSSLVNWGTTANPLGIRGYGAASNGQIPSKATGGITWITPTTGTVTNFSAGDLSPLFTTTEATTTTTPALSFALTNAAAHTYFGNATGSTAAPSYTSNAALSKTDDTNVTLTLGGAPTTSLLEAVSLTLGWTGTLSVARGGSGAGTLTGLLQGNGTSAFTAITNSSTTGQVLRVTGASTYAWGALDVANTSAVTGILDETNGGTGQSTITTGDILYGSSSNTLSKLGIGSTAQVLRVTGGVPVWGAIASTDLSNTANIALLNANQTFSGTNTFTALTTTSNEASTFASTVTTNASTLAGTSSHIYLNVASAGSSVTLPADANVTDGEILEIMNLNSNAIDIIPNTGQTINEVASQITDMPQYGHIVLKARLVSTVAHWMRWE